MPLAVWLGTVICGHRNGVNVAACTDTIRGKILDATRIGAYQKEAAMYAGVSENTLCRWLRTGRADIANGDEETECATFVTEFEAAEANAVIRALTVIHRAAAEGDWKAAVSWLSRRHPGRWGEHGRMDVTVTPVDPESIELAQLIREAKAKQAADEERLRRGEIE